MKVQILTALLILSLLGNIILLTTDPFQAVPDLSGTKETVDRLEQRNTELWDQIQQLKDQRNCQNQTIRLGEDSATLQAPAVLQRREIIREGPVARERITQQGSMINITAEVRSGRGRVLVDTRPLMGEIFQEAANTAVIVAQNRSGTSLSGQDVIFSIHALEEIPAVDGPSAGALMTLLVLSILEEKPVLENVTLTGTIDQEGRIGAIGGLLEKAQAARDAGKDRLLIPSENARMVRFVELTRTLYGFSIIEQRPEVVDAEEYLESVVGIDVIYVDTIDEVMDLATWN